MLAAGLTAGLQAQISNPIPEPIPTGDLVLELEHFVTVPASASGTPRARISALRALPDGRHFVNDQSGEIYQVEEDSAALYLDLPASFPGFIDSPGLGTGLQSFAFHPAFLENGKFYTTHTERWNAATPDFMGPTAPYNSGGQQGVVTEWTADDPTADVFAGSHRELFRVYFPGTVHGLQEIVFNPTVDPGHPDYGMLYICIGEGGSYLDGYASNEHRLDSPMGTIFRIDPLGNNADNGAYGIPADNPWAGDTDESVIEEIYAYGFRNPHRLSWDSGGDHLALVGDIGERNLEELNILVAGGDYGFPQREGTFLLQADQPEDNYDVYPLPADDDQYGYVYPVAQYDHDEGFAIMGGFVYRGEAIPALQGTYVFGDIKNGRVLYVDVNDLELGSLAEIQEARLFSDGSEVALQSLVGGSRTDLRFGVDGDNELYILTKTDGVIRRVANAWEGSTVPLDSNPADWTQVVDFEDGMGAATVRRTGSGGEAEITSDPYGASDNRVLAIAGADTAVTAEFSEIGANASASFYFRFALGDASTALSVGPTDSSTPSSVNQIQAEVASAGSGSVRVRDRFTLEEVASTLRPRVWYEGWIHFNGDLDSYDVYLRGGDYTAPARVAAGFRTKLPTVGALRHFIWAATGGSGEAATMYLDDLYLDRTGLNLSAPVAGGWSLVENFERIDSLDGWAFRDVEGSAPATPTSEESAQWLTEPSGNSYLSVGATRAGDILTMAIAPLPYPVQVGENITLYGRVRPESLETNLSWGVSNQGAESFTSLRFDAFETMLRLTNEEAGRLLIRDDQSFVAAAGSGFSLPQAGQWYEYWMIVRNGGEASGGQTYDVYWRPDSEVDAPTQIASDFGFRVAREIPLTHFGILANHGATTAPGRISFDDLFIAYGESLDRPAGGGIGIFPGPRGSKQSPWFGQLWDNDWPWIYHEWHAWLYVRARPAGDAWMWDFDLGWIYTGPKYYPYIYLDTDDEWAYYYPETRQPRWFYGYGREDFFTDEDD